MKKLFVISAALVLPAAAQAESFKKECPDIATCAKAVSRLLGQKYVIAPDVKGQIDSTDNLAFMRENAELLFTTMLYQNGYSRVPLKGEDTFQIIRIRDARDTAIPVYDAGPRNKPRFSGLWDIATLQYKAEHPEVVEAIARSLRSFLPANARVIPMEFSGLLLLTAAVPELEKSYEMIKAMDVKPSKEMLERWRREEEDRRKRMDHPGPPPGQAPGRGAGAGPGAPGQGPVPGPDRP